MNEEEKEEEDDSESYRQEPKVMIPTTKWHDTPFRGMAGVHLYVCILHFELGPQSYLSWYVFVKVHFANINIFEAIVYFIKYAMWYLVQRVLDHSNVYEANKN